MISIRELSEKLLLVLGLATSSLSFAQVTEYDISAARTGSYVYSLVGPYYSGGTFIGNEWSKVTTQTSFQYISPPATPLPASFTEHVSTYLYVAKNGVVVLDLGGTGFASDGQGDKLFWTQSSVTAPGTNTFTGTSTYTGGTGLFAGAYGTTTFSGTFDSTTQTQSWTSNTQLFVPAPVPEPETYAMMLAGLGLLGFRARRRTQQ